MKKVILFFVAIIALSTTNVWSQSKADDIIGEWLSQDKDGKILIYKSGDKYCGKISWAKEPKKDFNNPDPKLRTRERVGSVIMLGFVFDADDKEWTNGTIYDPNKGKTYDATVKLADHNTMNLRGYIGISLLGRTAVWTRAK